MVLLSKSQTLFETQDFTCWNGRFRPVDDATGLGANAAAEVLSRRHSHKPNPTSLSQLPNLSQSRYPLLLRNYSLLLLTSSTPRIQIRAILVFQVGNVNPSSTNRRITTNSGSLTV